MLRSGRAQAQDLGFMHEPESPPPSPTSGRFQALFRQGFQRLAALWATPGVGRVALCSPVVGIIAGLGAVAFLVCLQAMYSEVLGGLLHFHMPPTLEGKPQPSRIRGPGGWSSWSRRWAG